MRGRQEVWSRRGIGRAEDLGIGSDVRGVASQCGSGVAGKGGRGRARWGFSVVRVDHWDDGRDRGGHGERRDVDKRRLTAKLVGSSRLRVEGSEVCDGQDLRNHYHVRS